MNLRKMTRNKKKISLVNIKERNHLSLLLLSLSLQMRAATTQKIIDNSDCQMEEKSQESQVTTTCTEPKSERYVTHVDLSEPMVSGCS